MGGGGKGRNLPRVPVQASEGSEKHHGNKKEYTLVRGWDPNLKFCSGPLKLSLRPWKSSKLIWFDHGLTAKQYAFIKHVGLFKIECFYGKTTLAR